MGRVYSMFVRCIGLCWSDLLTIVPVNVAEDEDFEVEDVPKPPPAATDAWDGEDEDDDIKVCRYSS